MLQNPPKALEAVLKLQKKAESVNHTFLLQTQAFEAYYLLGKYDKADSIAEILFSRQNNISDSLVLMQFYRQYARLASIRIKVKEAVKYFDIAMNFYNKKGMFNKFCLTKINLAEHYRHYQNYQACERHLKEVLSYGPERLSDTIMANALHRKAALVAEANKDYKLAAEFSLESLTYSEKINHLQHMATSYNELGLLLLTSKPNEALNYFSKAQAIWEKQDAIREKANLLTHLARHFLDIRAYTKAEEKINEVLSIGALQTMPLVHYIALNLKAEIAYALGDYKSSYNFRDQGALLYEDVLYKQYNSKLTELSQRYETDLAIQKLQDAEKEKKTAIERSEKERFQKNRSLLGLVITTVLAITLGFFYQSNRKSKRKIEKQNEVIKQQNTALNESLEQKEVLLQEVHHRVKNNFQYTLALLEMQLTRTQHQEAKTSLHSAIRRMISMALVHEKLYGENAVGKIYLDEYLNELISMVEESAEDLSTPVEFKKQIVSAVVDFQRCICLGMILSELIANSFKYAFSGTATPEIRISITQVKQKFTLLYTDNGTGFKESRERGMGMRIIDMFSRQLEAKWELNSTAGVQFKLSFNGDEKQRNG